MIFSVTANSDRSLLTVAEARAAIGDDSAQVSSIDITALINRVSAAITRACRVPAAGATPPTLRKETVTAIYRLKCRQAALILPRHPVVTVTSVVENDVTLTENTDFETDAAAGMLKRLSGDSETCWPSGKITVVADCGWATVPDDLKQAAATLARAYWNEASRITGLRSEELPGVYSASYQDKDSDNPNIPFEVMQSLAPYMNNVVG